MSTAGPINPQDNNHATQTNDAPRKQSFTTLADWHRARINGGKTDPEFIPVTTKKPGLK